MSLIVELARGLWESIRETLPSTEAEAGVFVAGLAWGLVIYMVLLILVSYTTITLSGGRP